MRGFDTFVVVDWSGGNDTGPRPRKDAIWACVAREGEALVYLRNRVLAQEWLADLIDTELTAGRRVALGFDFPFGYPAGFAAEMTGQPDPLALWQWFADRIEDTPKANNRFDLAGEINLRLGSGPQRQGPFWGNGLRRDIPGLPRRKVLYHTPFADRRAVEHRAKGSFTCWQMSGVGAVGGQVMMGLPVLHRLRAGFAPHVAVWPFEPLDAPVALLEIWPSLTTPPAPDGWIKDAWQVHSVALDLARRPVADLNRYLNVTAPIALEEGWIFAVEPD